MFGMNFDFEISRVDCIFVLFSSVVLKELKLAQRSRSIKNHNKHRIKIKFVMSMKIWCVPCPDMNDVIHLFPVHADTDLSKTTS